MYIITKTKNLKRLGEVYKEEEREKHYKRAEGIIFDPRIIMIQYRIGDKDGTEKHETEAISMKDCVRVEVYESDEY